MGDFHFQEKGVGKTQGLYRYNKQEEIDSGGKANQLGTSRHKEVLTSSSLCCRHPAATSGSSGYTVGGLGFLFPSDIPQHGTEEAGN